MKKQKLENIRRIHHLPHKSLPDQTTCISFPSVFPFPRDRGHSLVRSVTSHACLVGGLNGGPVCLRVGEGNPELDHVCSAFLGDDGKHQNGPQHQQSVGSRCTHTWASRKPAAYSGTVCPQLSRTSASSPPSKAHLLIIIGFSLLTTRVKHQARSTAGTLKKKIRRTEDQPRTRALTSL